MSDLPLLIEQPIKAGFPNPADDASANPLDLNELVVKHPNSTFYLRVDGDSMEGIGLKTGDIVAVDRSLEAKSGNIVVAAIDGEFTLKRLKMEADQAWLVAENPKYHPIALHEAQDVQIWGVVTFAVQKLF